MVAGVLSSTPRMALADAMGYASIGSWLFAQAPQVVKNYRLQSCEGLALPFLCNWLFGDITNLVGCILTKQLPFQTYLAAYFCLVDFTLVVQYYHYRPPPAPRYASIIYTSPHQSLLIQTAPAHLASHSRTRSGSSIAARDRDRSIQPMTATREGADSSYTIRPIKSAQTHPTYSNGYTSPAYRITGPATALDLSGASSGGSGASTPGPEVHVISATPLPRDGSYAAIYEAALDVARAAERAEARRMSRSQSRPRRSRHQSTTSAQMMPLVDEAEGVDGDTHAIGQGLEDASPPGHMFESFHSDMSAVTTSSTASGGPEGGHGGGRSRTNGMSMSASTPALLDHRGRSLRRTGTGMALNVPTPPMEEGDDVDGLPAEGGQGIGVDGRQGRTGAGATTTAVRVQRPKAERSHSRSLSLARGSGGRGKGRRAAGVAFMSLAMLAFGRSRQNSSLTGNEFRSRHLGRVLDSPHNRDEARYCVRHPATFLQILQSATSERNFVYIKDHPHTEPSHTGPPPSPPDLQRLIGRISAWACTTLYLTSRLPQIWKNFQRRSVEGLSILLFLFAFVGNLTYVISIVLSAPLDGEEGEASHYLLEALPYLLGSGGTLLFDLTIMLQSLFYGSSPPIPPPQPSYSHAHHPYPHHSFHGHPHDRSGSTTRRPLFRRRTRYIEDGFGGAVSGTGSGTGERQPLLSGSIHESPTNGTAPHTYGTQAQPQAQAQLQGVSGAQEDVLTRERSLSPGVMMRGRQRGLGQGKGQSQAEARPQMQG